jgi:SulP family sulfate permease
MGLGVALFATMGFDASAGALAGLMGAAVLSLVSGLTGATIPLSLKRKEMVFTYGGLDNSLYFILQGEVDIRLPTRVYHYKRLAKIGPGSFFGEGGFLNPAPRTATAVVTQDVELLMLDRQALESLAEKRQREAGSAVLYELGRSLAQQLRWCRSELRRLERW